MGQLFQPLEAQESRGSLDGVDRTEYFPQQAGILRPLLQIGQAPFHAVQAFLAFDQELPRQFVHSRPLIRPAGIAFPARQALNGYIGWMEYDLRKTGIRGQRSGIRATIRGRSA